MNRYWIEPDGSYNEGDPITIHAVAVLQRPSPQYTNENGIWVLSLSALPQAKAAQCLVMDSAYSAASQAVIAYLGTSFQADDISTDRMVKAITIMTANSTTSISWWDTSNVAQTLTLAQLIGLGSTIMVRTQTLFAHLQARKTSIRAATTFAAVGEITW